MKNKKTYHFEIPKSKPRRGSPSLKKKKKRNVSIVPKVKKQTKIYIKKNLPPFRSPRSPTVQGRP